ncbi:MAG: hypothetical protein ONA90_06855 [candidate division KSB1 bacterium]|nr:hypothetical protein [candidate division KSB1 bacterium]
MDHPLLVLAAITGLGLAYVLFPVMMQVFMRYRRAQHVTCPEEGKAAAVNIDVRKAALAAAIDKTNLSLRNCSLWPMKRGCGQGCLAHLISLK